MQSRHNTQTLYMCDPEKNTGCTKDCCLYNPYAIGRWCCFTRNQAYARLNKRGKPIKATWYREMWTEDKTDPKSRKETWSLAAVAAITSALLTLLLKLLGS